MGTRISVQPEWCLDLPLQQQSVLFLAGRGPDGIGKAHPCKDVQRAYRAGIQRGAKIGRCYAWGERGDSFMSMDLIADDAAWKTVTGEFFHHVDELPHHFLMHLLHGAEILGYKHPDPRIAGRWREFYLQGCTDMHLTPETEEQMDERLGDWQQAGWDQ